MMSQLSPHYIADYSVTFERINLNDIKKFKLTLCIPGMDYYIPDVTYSNSALVKFEWKDLNDVGFFIVATIEHVTKVVVIQCRYLVVNDIEGSTFYFD